MSVYNFYSPLILQDLYQNFTIMNKNDVKTNIRDMNFIFLIYSLASLTLRETQGIHTSMNVRKMKSASYVHSQ